MGSTFCTVCGAQVNEGVKFCPNCGAVIGAPASAPVPPPVSEPVMSSVPNDPPPPPPPPLYSTPEASYAPPPPPPLSGDRKSKIVAALLGIFLGWAGVHRFYLGYTTLGIIQLVLGVVVGAVTCGIGTMIASIWGLVEGILILVGNIKTDAKGNPLAD